MAERCKITGCTTDPSELAVLLSRREWQIVASVLRERNGITLNYCAERIERVLTLTDY